MTQPALPSQAESLAPLAAAALGVLFLSLMDVFMKGAALAAGAYSATLLRSLFGAAIIAPFWLARRTAWPSKATLKLHLERGIVSAFMALLFFFALTKMPLAEAIALSFIAPLIALYLARILLAETVKREAIYASILGFSGTIVIVAGRFAADAFTRDFAIGLAALIASATLYAYNFIVIRRQSQLAGPIEVATFHSGVGGLVLLIFSPIGWQTPDSAALWGIAMAGLLTVTASMAIAWAYARASASSLVPMEYSGFLWASLFGYAFFNEEVRAATFVGATLIVAGCLWATRRSRS